MKRNPVLFPLLTALFMALIPMAASAGCPPKARLAQDLEKTFNKKLEVVKVENSEMPGICQIQVRLQGQNRLVYTDPKGKYFIAGQIFRISDRSNITKETIMELNRFTKAELKRLDELVAFSIGSGDKVFYFVTDPMCPYCKKAEQILEPLAREGKIKVNFLLYPLPFHQGAKEQCVSIICDNKGIEGLKGQYRSENQCAAGKEMVENTISFLKRKGIGGTPTYIFREGYFHSGVMQKSDLEKYLDL